MYVFIYIYILFCLNLFCQKIQKSKNQKIKNIQNIPQNQSSKNLQKRPPHPSDHLSAANDSAPSRRNGLSKTSPKISHPIICKNVSPIRRTIRRTIRPLILHLRNPQHNGLHVTTSQNKNKSIKVRPRKWVGGR